MTKNLKKEIEELIILATGEKITRNGLPISMLVEDIASTIDKEYAKVITEVCELGPMLDAIGMEIRGRNNA